MIYNVDQLRLVGSRFLSSFKKNIVITYLSLYFGPPLTVDSGYSNRQELHKTDNFMTPNFK